MEAIVFRPRRLVVSAVAHMVTNHCPSRSDSDRNQRGREQRVHWREQKQGAHDGAKVRPQYHLVQMLHIGLALLLLKLFAQSPHVFFELCQVQLFNPVFIVLRAWLGSQRLRIIDVGVAEVVFVVVVVVAFARHGAAGLSMYGNCFRTMSELLRRLGLPSSTGRNSSSTRSQPASFRLWHLTTE